MLKLLLTLLAFSAVAFAQLTVHPVVRVIDGDSLIINVNGVNERTRLRGIDTPEVRGAQFFASEATAFATGLLSGRNVTLDVAPARDPYGRLLAYVSVGSVDVSLALAQGGYADVYEPSTPEIRAAVAGAKSVHKGRFSTMTGKLRDYNCADFKTQPEAQSFFLGAQDIARDFHRLDVDANGVACERLPKVAPTLGASS